jgi:predicted nucleic acid-binding protein
VRVFFLDASALAKRYNPEVGTPLMNYLMTSVPQDRLYLFNVGMGEVLSLLVRKKNAGQLSAAAYSQALVEFATEILSSSLPHKVVADNDLVMAALPLIEAHSINATDAIILRLALTWPPHSVRPARIWSWWRRINGCCERRRPKD